MDPVEGKDYLECNPLTADKFCFQKPPLILARQSIVNYAVVVHFTDCAIPVPRPFPFMHVTGYWNVSTVSALAHAISFPTHSFSFRSNQITIVLMLL